MSNKFYNIAENLCKLLNNDYSLDPHMKETPKRVANYWNEIYQYSINRQNFNSDKETIDYLLKITKFENDYDIDIVEQNKPNKLLVSGPIRVYSVCSHHLAPIIGNTWIAYKPDKNLLGLSKLSRIAKLYARQPIVQELYTDGLYNLIKEYTNSDTVAVITYMRHLCMESRGVNDTNSVTLYYKSDIDNIFDYIQLEKP